MFKLRPDAPLFDWPEPLVIEIVREAYRDIGDYNARTRLARLHAAALGELFAGQERQAASLRAELVIACVGRGIATERVANVDAAVLQELQNIAAVRFRTSPRQQAAFRSRLDEIAEHWGGEAATPDRRRKLGATQRGLRPSLMATG